MSKTENKIIFKTKQKIKNKKRKGKRGWRHHKLNESTCTHTSALLAGQLLDGTVCRPVVWLPPLIARP